MLSKMKSVSACLDHHRNFVLQAVVLTAIISPALSFNIRERSSSLVDHQDGDFCFGKSDGHHSESTCTNYWLCKGGKTVLQRSCFDGTLFNGLMCVPSALVPNCVQPSSTHLTTASIECVGLKNGLHRDFYTSSCSDYVICENGKAIAKGHCHNDLVFDGNACVKNPAEEKSSVCGFENNNTEDEMECSHKTGIQTSSNCQSYFYCNNALGIKSQIFECPKGYTFDVNSQKCLTGYNCTVIEQEEIEFDFCSDKTDGYYQDALSSGCRSYVFCIHGKKIIYLCPEGFAFDGTSCQVDTSFECPYWSRDCVGKRNGYHADPTTACRQYIFCLNENKVMTLTCSKSRIFDGSRCVARSPNVCPQQGTKSSSMCDTKMDGKHVVPGSKCKSFTTCHAQRQIASSSCSDGFIFFINDCVKQNESMKCIEDVVKDDCKLDGFYKHENSNDCKDYYYCMNGQRTDLTCPGNTVFNGNMCVDPAIFSCSGNASNLCKLDNCTLTT